MKECGFTFQSETLASRNRLFIANSDTVRFGRSGFALEGALKESKQKQGLCW